jgi:hypothetical protein
MYIYIYIFYLNFAAQTCEAVRKKYPCYINEDPSSEGFQVTQCHPTSKWPGQNSADLLAMPVLFPVCIKAYFTKKDQAFMLCF